MKILHISCAIIVNKGQILACKREDERFVGWEFPGGKIEPGETAEQACLREVKEELSVELGPGFFYDTVEYDYPDFHLTMECFIYQLKEGQVPRPCVHTELRWLGRNELLDVDWLAADVGLVRSMGFLWEHIFAEGCL